MLRFLNPFGMFLGGGVVILVFMGSVWAGENKTPIKNFKRKNPTVFVIGVMVTSYFLLSLCGGVLVFLFGITFPLLSKSLYIPTEFSFHFHTMFRTKKGGSHLSFVTICSVQFYCLFIFCMNKLKVD